MILEPLGAAVHRAQPAEKEQGDLEVAMMSDVPPDHRGVSVCDRNPVKTCNVEAKTPGICRNVLH
jgi:hypothetical protein